MGIEIERKFLVDKQCWEQVDKNKGEKIVQGYLSKSPEKTIRIRTKGEKGYLTIKGKTEGISRLEYEYEIPKHEAEDLIKTFCSAFIQKIRYEIIYEGLLWEIDEFQSPKSGLILAEVELKNEQENVKLPSWVMKEVSDDPAYFNANML